MTLELGIINVRIGNKLYKVEPVEVHTLKDANELTALKKEGHIIKEIEIDNPW